MVSTTRRSATASATRPGAPFPLPRRLSLLAARRGAPFPLPRRLSMLAARRGAAAVAAVFLAAAPAWGQWSADGPMGGRGGTQSGVTLAEAEDPGDLGDNPPVEANPPDVVGNDQSAEADWQSRAVVPADGEIVAAYNRQTDLIPDYGGGLGAGAMVFDDAETIDLIANGWTAPPGAPGTRGIAAAGPAAFDDPDLRARISLLVRLAVQQGHPAHVGALQAQYGTPQENGLADLQQRIDMLAALPNPTAQQLADLARLRAELVSQAADVKPGPGPAEGWELVNLDANGDGRIDSNDLN